ncbi:MAG: alpha/beta hydrolase [Leptolyngbya sp. RL_3_1]|nr:alpha/beta hydrolase [Leptolyngbya sp. RL_3_1]
MFLHGNWADGSQWIPLITQLSHRFHCVAPDLLGFGESSRLPPKQYSIALQSESLGEYLASIRSRSIVLVAEGVGAWVATHYAQMHPTQVQGLIVMAPEGVTSPSLGDRWAKTRWLAKQWSLGAMGLALIGPLMTVVGRRQWLHRMWQRRRQLRQYEATCRLLFLRRRQDLQAERLERLLPELRVPVQVLQPQPASATTQALNRAYSDCLQHQALRPIPVAESAIWASAAEIEPVLQRVYRCGQEASGTLKG